MKERLEALCWPMERLGEAMELLARRTGLATCAVEAPRMPEGLLPSNDLALERWMETAAQRLGFEADLVDVAYADVERLVRSCAPALVRLHVGGSRFLAVLRSGRQEMVLLDPHLDVHRVPTEALLTVLCEPMESPLLPSIERLMDEAGVPRRQRKRTRQVILRERIRDCHLHRCWHLRPAPGTSLTAQLRRAGLFRKALALVTAHAAGYVLWLLSWWLVGRGALADRFAPGWLVAWGLLLLSLVPLRYLASFTAGTLALGLGGILKQRLLAGALLLEPDEVRHQGAGQLLGRVLEAEQVEALGLGGGLMGAVAGLELLLALGILAIGPGGLVSMLLLVLWMGVGVLLAVRYRRQRERWTQRRLEMTNDLVERMVGHRTRLAQEEPERWHDAEDRGLARYLEQTRQLDRAQLRMEALLPRGWLLVGILGLARAFMLGGASPAALAVGVGGVLLAYRALRSFVSAGIQLLDAAVAWRQVAALYGSATKAETAAPAALVRPDDRSEGAPLLEAHRLFFRYRERSAPVVRGCDLRVRVGDRLLLEGPSGGGKSTLGALLAGLRVPQEGVLLLDGLDRRTLGLEGWRRRVVAAPQFQENHVLSGTFAFNLLMGRRWPPRPEDLDKARELCRALGLEGLLKRMPAGLQQIIGETGWQLSHGERSRLYLARALLQDADLVVLDESFAALDPETLRQSLECVLERAPTVLVIAHP